MVSLNYEVFEKSNIISYKLELIILAKHKLGGFIQAFYLTINNIKKSF